MNGDNKKLVLAAMVFAVAMLFIDQTIVTLAIPNPSIYRTSRTTARGLEPTMAS